jgi:hypothetical protein
MGEYGLKVEGIEKIYTFTWVTQKRVSAKRPRHQREAKHVICSSIATFNFATSTLKQDLQYLNLQRVLNRRKLKQWPMQE